MDPTLSYSRVDHQQSAETDPIQLKSTCPNSTASSAAATGTVTGYPVSLGQYSSTETTAYWSPCEKKMVRIYKASVMVLIFLPLFLITALGFIPESPYITLFSTSLTAVHNVSDVNHFVGNLDVGFYVQSEDPNGMIYKDLSMLANFDDKLLSSESTTIAPFEQGGYRQSTVWFTLRDIRVPVSELVESEARILVTLEVRGRVRYKSITWAKKEISIKALCGERKLGFLLNNLNARETTTSQKLHADSCEVRGSWITAQRWIIFGVPSVFFVLVCSFAIVVGLLCCFVPSIRLIIFRQIDLLDSL